MAQPIFFFFCSLVLFQTTFLGDSDADADYSPEVFARAYPASPLPYNAGKVDNMFNTYWNPREVTCILMSYRRSNEVSYVCSDFTKFSVSTKIIDLYKCHYKLSVTDKHGETTETNSVLNCLKAWDWMEDIVRPSIVRGKPKFLTVV